MAKYKPRTVVHTSQNGPVRMAVEASEGVLSLFTAKARNDLVRDAAWQAGEFWRLTFLPMRFTEYAKKLGYYVQSSTRIKKLKAGRQLPLVWTGDLRDMATNGSSTTARATSSKTEAVIRIPGPGYMNQQPLVYKTLRTIPTWEVERFAEVLEKALAANIEEAAPTVRSDLKKQGLSEAQQSKLSRSKHVPKSRRAPGASSRRAI